MNELKNNKRINLDTVDFYKAMQFIRAANQRGAGGVDWAEVYVAVDGRAVVVYKRGGGVKTHYAQGVEEVVEWFGEIPRVRRDGALTHDYEMKYRRSYQVDLTNLMKRGGARSEEGKARLFINRVYDAAGGGYDLSRQRPAPFSYR